MKSNSGIMIVLAYPETVVRVSDEWLVKRLYLLGMGRKNYIRAGHSALILIEKSTGNYNYYDFGRYITPFSKGRVRSKLTDHELDFPFEIHLKGSSIQNIDEILGFLATHPRLTHGEGKMLASICTEIDFENARTYIQAIQDYGFLGYSAFGKNDSNCSRFVTDVLLASVSDASIRKKLRKLKRFTPSTIGNVLVANTSNTIYQVSEEGNISVFTSTEFKENLRLFTDSLKLFQPKLEGNLEEPIQLKPNENAQWLGGTGSGAWFELYGVKHNSEYGFKRISPYGTVDVNGIYKISEDGFSIDEPYEFTHHSNCHFFHIKQNGRTFRFDFLRKRKN